MRSLRSCCLVVVLAACADERPADTAATGDTARTAAATRAGSLGSYAGTWNMRTMGPTSDSVLLEFTMTATSTTAGWSYDFPNSATPVPIRIISMGTDSVVTEAGPYASNFRPGTQATTRATVRIDGDTLRGAVVATYATASGDSAANLRTVGTRAP